MTTPRDLMTLNDLLTQHTDRGGRVLLVDGSTRLTYADVNARVDEVAAWLQEHGVQRGRRVMIHMRKGAEEIIGTLATARVGGVFVNVNYQWDPGRVMAIVAHTAPTVLLTDRERGQALREEKGLDQFQAVAAAGGAIDHPRCIAWSDITRGRQPSRQRLIDADLATLIHTSGSTGTPKWVVFTHRNVICGAQSVATYLGNRDDDRVLAVLPMNFDYGLNQLTTMLLVGGTLVLEPTSDVGRIVEAVDREQITGLGAVTPLWIELVRHLEDTGRALPSLRYITNSGGLVPRKIAEAMPRVFPNAQIFLMYGLTETFRTTYLPPELFTRKMSSIGQAIPNSEVFVVDPKRGLCGPGQRGELIVRGALLSRGYWRDPERTAAVFKVNEFLRPLLGDEKTLHSGDLVEIDADGDLTYIGRLDTMINSSGDRISPTEVEDVLYQLGEIAEVVAFGASDAARGQVVHIVTTTTDERPADVAKILAHCRAHMPAAMVPRGIGWMPGRMPRTSSGKIDRTRVIREQAGTVVAAG